ncbi:hypothetical protein CLCR_07817 [Cladophialophora carrionii]|uniref:Uncharacterized protein n=1 Tax=Cladophialophora carrionii TaxID=86049 RepID=A0A1C1CM85_9EURO|nr:hypothetical protein CLCR_07817 [Cladophialophora carrionii]
MAVDLSRLDNVGIRLEEGTDRPIDWARQPPSGPRPYSFGNSGRRHAEFTEHDDRELVQWMVAAKMAGLRAGDILDELSALVRSPR